MFTVINLKKTHFYDFSALPEMIKNGEPIADWLASKFNDEVLNDNLPYFVKESADVEVILGCDDPTTFVEEINQWNKGIKENAMKCMKKWTEDGCPLGDDVSSSTPARVAMQEADDEFTTLGYHCVVGQYGELHTVLTDDEMAEMREHPEDYAIVDLYFAYD